MAHSHILKYSCHIHSPVANQSGEFYPPFKDFFSATTTESSSTCECLGNTFISAEELKKKIAFYINCGLVFLNAFNQDG